MADTSTDEDVQVFKKRKLIEERCIIHYDNSSNKNFVYISKLKDSMVRFNKLKEIKTLWQNNV